MVATTRAAAWATHGSVCTRQHVAVVERLDRRWYAPHGRLHFSEFRCMGVGAEQRTDARLTHGVMGFGLDRGHGWGLSRLHEGRVRRDGSYSMVHGVML